MEREKHIKGYYRSYLERWGKKRKIRKPTLRKKTSKKGRKVRPKKELLRDHPEMRKKYEPREPIHRYENEMMNIHDYPSEEEYSEEEEMYPPSEQVVESYIGDEDLDRDQDGDRQRPREGDKLAEI
jgi:hypothetical protein